MSLKMTHRDIVVSANAHARSWYEDAASSFPNPASLFELGTQADVEWHDRCKSAMTGCGARRMQRLARQRANTRLSMLVCQQSVGRHSAS
jgi:hypothetical protein